MTNDLKILSYLALLALIGSPLSLAPRRPRRDARFGAKRARIRSGRVPSLNS